MNDEFVSDEGFEPSEKSPEMEKFLENLFGRSTFIRKGICISCGKTVVGFRDALSEKEYTISGLCQECQDEVFG